jgi:3-oxoacyl-[acyl-carrier-protein] synthase II
MEFNGCAMNPSAMTQRVKSQIDTQSHAVITGVGLVTPLGHTADETWNSLLLGRTIDTHARVPDLEAEDRTFALAGIAARAALNHAGWTEALLSRPDTALIVGTSKGPVEIWLRGKSPQLAGGLAQTAAVLGEALGFGCGPRLTYSAACASGLHALIRAAIMLQCGEAERVLVVGVEASAHPLFISSFQRLGVIAPQGFGCRPFDRSRRGFLMSEAAAAVCLEKRDTALTFPIARIDRFAIGGDGAHLTAGDPTGATLRQLLKSVIDCQSVDLIHAHGTGTLVNDPMELAALDWAIPGNENHPIVFSHKGALGHSLGASGLVSVVLNCMMHQLGMVPPNIHTHSPLPVERLRINRETVRIAVQRSLVIASGFGGPTAVVGLVSP